MYLLEIVVAGKLFLKEMQRKFVELYTKSVFFGWYRLVFLGNYHTDTEGKLGQYFQYRRYKKVRIYSK